MGKPDRAIFEEWFSAESATPALEYFYDLVRPFAGMPRPEIGPEIWEKVIEKLHLADDAYKSMWKATERSSAMVWANKQPGFTRAEKLLWAIRKNVRQPASEKLSWVDRAANRFARRSDRGLEELEVTFSQTLANSWESNLFHALYEYFYQDHAAQMYALARHGPTAVQAITTSLDKVLLPLLIALPEYRKSGFVKRLQLTLKILQEDETFKTLPIKRDTKHKAEQLFVYRMWQANMRWYGKPKPDAIAELMTMDGFERQFDERTIERMCAKFKAAKFKVYV